MNKILFFLLLSSVIFNVFSQESILGSNINNYITEISIQNFAGEKYTDIYIKNPPVFMEYRWNEVMVVVKDEIIIGVVYSRNGERYSHDREIRVVNELLTYLFNENYIIEITDSDNNYRELNNFNWEKECIKIIATGEKDDYLIQWDPITWLDDIFFIARTSK
jgi:uncharacterized membrane protein